MKYHKTYSHFCPVWPQNILAQTWQHKKAMLIKNPTSPFHCMNTFLLQLWFFYNLWKEIPKLVFMGLVESMAYTKSLGWDYSAMKIHKERRPKPSFDYQFEALRMELSTEALRIELGINFFLLNDFFFHVVFKSEVSMSTSMIISSNNEIKTW